MFIFSQECQITMTVESISLELVELIAEKVHL